MSQTIHRLVYFSKNRISPGNTVPEIQAILDASHRNNSKLGLTGALIFNAGIFAQMLEGHREHIESIFEKIQQDQRHGDVLVLGLDRVVTRTFPHWSMAHLGRSRQGEDLLGHIGKATGFEAARLDGDRLLNIIRNIALEEELGVP